MSVISMPLSKALHMSYTVSAAADTPTSASISTPVWAVVVTREVSSTPFLHSRAVTSMCVNGTPVPLQIQILDCSTPGKDIDPLSLGNIRPLGANHQEAVRQRQRHDVAGPLPAQLCDSRLPAFPVYARR